MDTIASTAAERQPRREIDRLVIEELALSENELIERCADLQNERDTYRQLAQLVLGAVHDVTIDRDNLRRQLAAVRTELRDFRARVMRTQDRAA